MRHLLTVIAVMCAIGGAHSAFAQIPVTDVLLNSQTASMAVEQIKDAAVQVQQLTTEIGTYEQAIENSIRIPMQTLGKAEALYEHGAAIANAAGTIIGPDGTILQRFHAFKNVGAAAGNLPEDAEHNAEWLAEEWKHQLDTDAELLNMTSERQRLTNEMFGDASMAAGSAVGQMAALDAANLQAKANGEMLRDISMSFTTQMEQQLIRDQRDVYEREAAEAFAQDYADQLKALAHADVGIADQSPITWGR